MAGSGCLATAFTYELDASHWDNNRKVGEERLRYMVTTCPEIARFHEELGLFLAEEGQDEEALRELRETLRLKRNSGISEEKLKPLLLDITELSEKALLAT